jgi:hypothetical protein
VEPNGWATSSLGRHGKRGGHGLGNDGKLCVCVCVCERISGISGCLREEKGLDIAGSGVGEASEIGRRLWGNEPSCVACRLFSRECIWPGHLET